MNFEYLENNKFFAQAPGLMEALCEEELIELGAKNTEKVYRGIYFEADKESIYRINYCARMISRVLAPLFSMHVMDAKELTRTASKVPWEKLFSVNETFSITASVAKSRITNSLYAAQCLKDGIADYFRDKYGKRPDVATVNPDVRFNLHIETDRAVISLDTSGESLHKRGYRLAAGEAPMQESLAAAIIRITDWYGEKTLWDPMCGSGTIVCEALMSYCRIPAQYLRKKFGFTHLPDYDKSIWTKVKSKCDLQIRPLPNGLIKGSDKSQKIIKAAQENLSRLPYGETVEITGQPFQHITEFKDGILVTNPPYGIRLGELEEVKMLYSELGDFIKQKCTGTTAYIYTGSPQLRKNIGLRTSRRIPLVNGQLEGVLLQIDSYEGSIKRKYREE
ncbi:hypothetical protein APF79_03810 [bacterium BRH_c32]|nr:MAG: hypothetical protein APF79_03810 [bacterium BRH_c32]